MNKLVYIFCFLSTLVGAQSFAPKPGEIGSTAIFKDSSIILGWATHVEIERGYLDISSPSLGKVDYGQASDGEGKAEGNSFDIVSLGDSGIAIITFDRPIENGEGPDFAVFENGFADDFIELAFVEVSSDGIKYVRFPSSSEASITVQTGPYAYSDCRFFNNLAGKYKQGYGTPFDLEDLKDSLGIDIMNITHVKLVDVIGTINPQFGSFDSQGNIINDLYPTAFPSGGFDLDGVGVIHQGPLGLKSIKEKVMKVYPNPTNGTIHIETKNHSSVVIKNTLGEIVTVFEIDNNGMFDLSNYEKGIYFVEIKSDSNQENFKIIHY